MAHLKDRLWQPGAFYAVILSTLAGMTPSRNDASFTAKEVPLLFLGVNPI